MGRDVGSLFQRSGLGTLAMASYSESLPNHNRTEWQNALCENKGFAILLLSVETPLVWQANVMSLEFSTNGFCMKNTGCSQYYLGGHGACPDWSWSLLLDLTLRQLFIYL